MFQRRLRSISPSANGQFSRPSITCRSFDNREIVRQKFSPSVQYQSRFPDRLEALQFELIYEHRYFPKATLNEDRLTELLSQLMVEPNEIPKNGIGYFC